MFIPLGPPSLPHGFRHVQEKKNNVHSQRKELYRNNRGSFWELENRIMGRGKRIMCGGLPLSGEYAYVITPASLPLSHH